MIGMPELFAGVAAIIAGAWVLIQLAGKQFERRLDERFVGIGTKLAEHDNSLADGKARFEHQSAGLARIELEIAKRENEALRTFATKPELEGLRAAVQDETRSVLGEVRALGERMDKRFDQVFNALDKKQDKKASDQ